MAVVKKLISPFQRVLLSKRMCPGCTLPLDKLDKHVFDADSDMIICKCKRMYIYDKNTDGYRRATLREAEEFSKGK